ncbi:hypothetical protein [Cronobacter dublinensis]|uniref:hypothetical protein n=1 Tax=Cronobacter dublinensis TaxID=413497 RepID=UPI0024AFDFDF|nr:hypothetical protein [Cronobacter dublinensis]MDI7383110.1 hypothetical protein [Cronobacter dublinensis]
MTLRIETRNHYLRYALNALLPPARYEQETCIIDLSSYPSFLTILQCVCQHKDAARFIFIGDAGLHSRALQPLISLETKLPLQSYYEKLRHCPGVSYETAMKSLHAQRNMEAYSHQDKTTVYSLLLRDTMHEAARFIGISNKQFYRRLYELTKKLNQQSGLHTHLFFRREFHPDYVRTRIDDQLRVSLHRDLRTQH